MEDVQPIPPPSQRNSAVVVLEAAGSGDPVAPASADDAEAKALVDLVYDDVKSMIVGRKYDASNWITLVVLCMESIEKVASLSQRGYLKRELCIEVVIRLVGELNLPAADLAGLQAMVEKALPNVIDALIGAAKNIFQINTIPDFDEVVTGCFGRCRGQN